MAKQFTRRHWGREVTGALSKAVSFFQGASGLGSMLRLVLFGAWVAFLMNFPAASEWTEWNTKAFAMILLTLVLDTLVANIPIADMLNALRAASLWVASKGMAVVGSTITSVTEKKESVTTTSVNGAEPEEGAVGLAAKWPDAGER